MNVVLRQLRPPFIAVVVFTVICGLAYPLVVTGVAQVGWGDTADGPARSSATASSSARS